MGTSTSPMIVTMASTIILSALGTFIIWVIKSRQHPTFKEVEHMIDRAVHPLVEQSKANAETLRSIELSSARIEGAVSQYNTLYAMQEKRLDKQERDIKDLDDSWNRDRS